MGHPIFLNCWLLPQGLLRLCVGALSMDPKTNTTQTTQAMMASPHVFFVEQFEDTIGLKIKGDEHEHWVTDIDGKYNSP